MADPAGGEDTEAGRGRLALVAVLMAVIGIAALLVLVPVVVWHLGGGPNPTGFG